MRDKQYDGAPFGVQTARFDVSGVHPRHKLPGGYTQIAYDTKYTNDTARSVGPGRYCIDMGSFSDKAVSARASGPGWSRAYEVERMAAQPHLLFKDEWESRRLLKKKMGPGTYETPKFLQTGHMKECPKRGVCNTLANRFAEIHMESFPGPGTYGKGGIPDAVYQDKQNESTSTIGMLDSGGPAGFDPGIKRRCPGPGTYKHTSFTDQFGKKKGPSPFELYSYDRTKPIITGHYATLKDYNLAPGQYEIESTLDEWSHQYKKKHGKFSKLTRFPTWPTDRHSLMAISICPKPKSQPGPCFYEPIYFPEYEKSPNAPPFLQTSLRKSLARQGNTVGPGRYDIQKFEDNQHKNGHASLFKSKAPNRPSEATARLLKERLRGKDIMPEEREEFSGRKGAENVTRKHLDWGPQRCVTIS